MPTFGEVLASNIITLLLLLIILGLYIAGKVLLMRKIYGEKKMWQGAIPVLGLIPVIGLIPYFIFCYKLPAAFGEKQPAFPYLTIFFSPIIMLMLATDQKYEYQYVRGKNVPFQGAFALNNVQTTAETTLQSTTEVVNQPTPEVDTQPITEAPTQPVVENSVQPTVEAPAQPVAENLPSSAPEVPVQSAQGTPIESQSPSVSENQVQSSDLNNLQ